MARIDETLGSATVLDAQGQAQQLGRLFADRPVALVFVRHFG